MNYYWSQQNVHENVLQKTVKTQCLQKDIGFEFLSSFCFIFICKIFDFVAFCVYNPDLYLISPGTVLHAITHKLMYPDNSVEVHVRVHAHSAKFIAAMLPGDWKKNIWIHYITWTKKLWKFNEYIYQVKIILMYVCRSQLNNVN